MHPLITSRQNPRVQEAARLRDRRWRQEHGRIIIDGPREISRALSAQVEVVELFVCEALLGPETQSLLKNVPAKTEILRVTARVYDKLAFGDRLEGLVAVANAPRFELADLQLLPRATVAVLEGVEKPGNVGAVIRSADAAGVAAVICSEAGTDVYNPNAIRASAGTIFSLPLVADENSTLLPWLLEQRFSVYAARVDAATEYTRVDYAERAALVVGSEAHGLSDFWRGEHITPIRLPMRGWGDSLNVSVTAAVLFYEVLRQREGR